uniref:Putative transcriptional activator TAF-1-like isoform X2 n=1 Tax=Davidia involucrata TaxID=16924 RepID=A0A5B7A442_DAVIN
MTMGNSEEGKPCKPEKPSSPALDQTNIHVYPDWAAMQAYYGHRVAVPPYFNSAVASGNAPHPYMWGPPQAMMPPYGAPYAAIYAHGGVYAHPGVPLVSPNYTVFTLLYKFEYSSQQALPTTLGQQDGSLFLS